MKIKNLSLLLASSFLISSASYAGYGELSDAYNGIIPEEVKPTSLPLQSKEETEKRKNEVKKWKAAMNEKFKAKTNQVGNIYEQIERLFAPLVRQGNEETRILANTLCDFFCHKLNKAGFVQELFDCSDLEKDAPNNLGSHFQQGKPPEKGIHIGLTRDVKNLSEEIQAIEKMIKEFPTKIEQWDKECAQQEAQLKMAFSLFEDIKNKKTESKTASEKIEQNIQKKIQQRKEQQTKYDQVHRELEELKIEKQKELDELNKQQPKKSRENDQDSSIEEVPNKSEGESTTETKSLLEPVQEGIHKVLTELEESIRQINEKYEESMKAPETILSDLKKNIDALNLEIETFEEGLRKEGDAIKALEIEEKRVETKKTGLEEQLIEQTRKIYQGIELNESLPRQKEEKEQKRRELQDKADIYALVKYLTYMNIYLALPQDDVKSYEYEEKLLPLSPYSLPLTRDFIDTRAATVGKHNTKISVDREMQEFEKTAAKTAATMQEERIAELVEMLKSNVKIVVGNLGEYALPRLNKENLLQDIFFSFQKPLDSTKSKLNSDSFKKKFEKERPNRHAYYPMVMTDGEFDDLIKLKFQSQRADILIRKSMEKWRSKISLGSTSFVHRVGLDSALFNRDFDFKAHAQMISLEDLKKEFGKEHEVRQEKIVSKSKSANDSVWGLGTMQLKHTYFNALTSDDKKTAARINPILEFVKHKESSHFKRSEKVKFEEKIEKETSEEGRHKLLTKALLKGISYMNMFYALRFNEKGEKLPELQTVPPVLEKYLSEQIPQEKRIDNVMGRKALKWMERVQKYGEEFMETHALSAYIFKRMNVSDQIQNSGKMESN